MDTIYILIIAIGMINAHVKMKNKDVLRVYNGEDNTSKYPYVVALMTGTTEISNELLLKICSGTLIQTNWVLSAAHCLVEQVKNIQYGNMSVPFADTDTKCKVLKMIQHPHYNEVATRNDIGLLLVTPAPINIFGKVSAVDYRTLAGQAVEYAGYGSTFMQDNKTPNKFLIFLIDLVRPVQTGEGVVKNCDELFTKNYICVSAKCSRRQLVLPGDSGGPLFCDNKIVGVACAITLDYSEQIFTPVSPYLTWIYKVLAAERARINPRAMRETGLFINNRQWFNR